MVFFFFRVEERDQLMQPPRGTHPAAPAVSTYRHSKDAVREMSTRSLADIASNTEAVVRDLRGAKGALKASLEALSGQVNSIQRSSALMVELRFLEENRRLVVYEAAQQLRESLPTQAKRDLFDAEFTKPIAALKAMSMDYLYDVGEAQHPPPAAATASQLPLSSARS